MAALDRKLLHQDQEFRRIATRYDKTDVTYSTMFYQQALVLLGLITH
jgi:hypothetical protein